MRESHAWPLRASHDESDKESNAMATERSTTESLEVLLAQATCLWGEKDAERQRSGLQRAAEEIAIMNPMRCCRTWNRGSFKSLPE